MVVDTILAMQGGKASSRGRKAPTTAVTGPGRAARGGMGDAAARRAAKRNENERTARKS